MFMNPVFFCCFFGPLGPNNTRLSLWRMFLHVSACFGTGRVRNEEGTQGFSGRKASIDLPVIYNREILICNIQIILPSGNLT